MDQMLQPLMNFRLHFWFHEQQQKSPAPSSEKLPSDRSNSHGFLVQMVDFGRRDFVGKASFTQPALVKQSSDFLDWRLRILEDLDGFINHLFHAIQLASSALEVLNLRLGYLGCNS